MRKCRCESSYCDHIHIHNSTCPNNAGYVVMDYVGSICDDCAKVAIDNDGEQYLLSQRSF